MISLPLRAREDMVLFFSNFTYAHLRIVRKWQFPLLYQQVAEPSALKADTTWKNSHPFKPYKVLEAWEAMRRRHTMECQEFIKHHQSKCLHVFTEKVKPETLQQLMHDRFNSWHDSASCFCCRFLFSNHL